jgi:DNA replication protein DnaC
MKFTDAAQNLVLVGRTGTGKTHLATALGVSGIQNHSKRVRFYSTVELVNTLEQEKAAGKQGILRLVKFAENEAGIIPKFKHKT